MPFGLGLGDVPLMMNWPRCEDDTRSDLLLSAHPYGYAATCQYQAVPRATVSIFPTPADLRCAIRMMTLLAYKTLFTLAYFVYKSINPSNAECSANCFGWRSGSSIIHQQSWCDKSSPRTQVAVLVRVEETAALVHVIIHLLHALHELAVLELARVDTWRNPDLWRLGPLLSRCLLGGCGLLSWGVAAATHHAGQLVANHRAGHRAGH